MVQAFGFILAIGVLLLFGPFSTYRIANIRRVYLRLKDHYNNIGVILPGSNRYPAEALPFYIPFMDSVPRYNVFLVHGSLTATF